MKCVTHGTRCALRVLGAWQAVLVPARAPRPPGPRRPLYTERDRGGRGGTVHSVLGAHNGPTARSPRLSAQSDLGKCGTREQLPALYDLVSVYSMAVSITIAH